MIEFLRVLLGKPLECKHEWSLIKQMIDGDKVFLGRRCKLCRKVEPCKSQ
jgi:hypothetical protein